MSERIKTPIFDIGTHDPVYRRQQIRSQQESTIVPLWRSQGVDETSIERNRNNQEWEIRRCMLQLRYPKLPILPHQSKKDRINSARKRLKTILSGMQEAAELNKRGLRQTSSKNTHSSENGNRLYGQEQSFDHNGGVIFATNSDDNH
ncbi:MAG: hypothetical protein KatS3mg089_0313 [Patescibacteria group bacterium]|nr:MAG: hypothetical protein KatS3mg089_0313 [Patescibacteria group bacterium]